MKKTCFYNFSLFFLICSGCTLFSVCFFESNQLNNQKSLREKLGRSIPVDPVSVEALVIKEYIYEGGDTSLDTWPHRRFILKIKDGQLPNKRNTKKFEYHTHLLESPIEVGDVLIFIFDQEGRLYEVMLADSKKTKRELGANF